MNFQRIRRLSLKTEREPSRRNSGRSMLKQSKEVLCICVSFQESRDSIKEELETYMFFSFTYMFLSN